MWYRLSFLILWSFMLVQPLQAVAQQTQPPLAPQPPQWYGPGPWHMWADGYGHGWPFWWIFPLMMMLFMVVVCGLIVFFFARRPWIDGPHHWGLPPRMMDRPWGDPSRSALQILSERFARGEIQKDEYEEKKAAILSGGAH
jgi:putative membrane protein